MSESFKSSGASQSSNLHAGPGRTVGHSGPGPGLRRLPCGESLSGWQAAQATTSSSTAISGYNLNAGWCSRQPEPGPAHTGTLAHRTPEPEAAGTQGSSSNTVTQTQTSAAPRPFALRAVHDQALASANSRS
eukprot:3578997-Rhodomonas_salina.4